MSVTIGIHTADHADEIQRNIWRVYNDIFGQKAQIKTPILSDYNNLKIKVDNYIKDCSKVYIGVSGSVKPAYKVYLGVNGIPKVVACNGNEVECPSNTIMVDCPSNVVATDCVCNTYTFCRGNCGDCDDCNDNAPSCQCCECYAEHCVEGRDAGHGPGV